VDQLLTTKFYIPTIRAELVSRLRLIEQLNEGLNRKLILISAPAGYGKTTLVSEWVQQLRLNASTKKPDCKIAWLSLDERDNDLTQFLIYFVTALIRVEGIDATFGSEALGLFQSPQPPPAEAVLTTLINEIAAIPGQIVLILDDYHLIESGSIQEAINFFLENLPPQMHLVIATREDPNFPLSLLRARDQLTEIRATNLRFSYSETSEFLNQVMDLDLSMEDINALESRTEGWITGLQLAAISMLGRDDATDFIKSFTGSHRFILDYLVEEILDRQPAKVKDFLLQTAILDRLTGSLCNALTGQDNGQENLEVLDHANLFIVPLDEERRWYRYHHLFSELLHHHLVQSKPNQLLILHSKASKWYSLNGLPEEAIEYAFRAEEFERAAHLIEEQADVVWASGEHNKMWRWLDILPPEVVASRPELTILRAANFFTRGQPEAAEQSLHTAEQALTASKELRTESTTAKHHQLPEIKRLSLLGRISAMRALIASYQGDTQSIIAHARLALDILPIDDIWRSPAAITLADAQGYMGEMAAAHKADLEAIEICKKSGNLFLIIYSHVNLAITLRQQGRLEQALEICQQQMQLAAEKGMGQTGVVGWLSSIWGEALVEVNNLDAALAKANRGVDLTERSGDIMMLGWSYPSLIRVLISRGDLAGAQETIQRMEKISQGENTPPWIMSTMAAWQARIWLAQDKHEAVTKWLLECGLDIDGKLTYLHELEYMVLARILIAQRRMDDAIRLLSRLLDGAEIGGRTSRVIEINILQALARQAQGDIDQAMAALERALNDAKTGGFIRTFIDEGPPMSYLLKETLNRGIAPEYVRWLLGAFPVDEPERTIPSKRQSKGSDLLEQLSEREIEVLQLIAEGLTNSEIAARLYLSLNTVKVHTRNIYGKLGANNRTQAVVKGRKLGILKPN
jgi:LuxR family maltose regulon positive regulatory protein